MNPDHFRSGARWSGREDYRGDTPGSVESTFDSNIEFDPFFNTDSCGIDKMEPSCGQPLAPEPGPTAKSARKKRMAQNDKASAVTLPTDEVNNKYALKSMDYSDEEYKILVQCWINK